MPEFMEQRRNLVTRMDSILREITEDISRLNGKSIRMGEYLDQKKRVGPQELKAAAVFKGQVEEPLRAPEPFQRRVGALFKTIDKNFDRCEGLTTWTILQNDDHNHLRL